jgi:hypothetical protein
MESPTSSWTTHTESLQPSGHSVTAAVIRDTIKGTSAVITNPETHAV